jgi:hypothetical protein
MASHQCQSTATYCGHDVRKLAGITPACPVCKPFMAQMRELAGWRRDGNAGRFTSPTLTAAQKAEISTP